MAEALRLVFMGTAEFAVPCLRALAASRHALAAVYTRPPRPAGRGQRPRLSAVHAAAEALGLETRTPATLRDPDVQAAFAALRADLALVAAYGLILPPPILAAPRLGCVNVHASLLPRWRGAAPIQRALLAGDDETGITLFKIDQGLDTGPVLTAERLPIDPRAEAAAVHDALAALAARMVVPVIEAYAEGRLAPMPQPAEGATYATKIDKAEGRIDWARPAEAIARQLRALNPWPGCWTEIGGTRVVVLAGELAGGTGPPGLVLDDQLTVACGEGALRLVRLQRAGRQPMPAADFLRGHPVPPGTRLG